MKVVRKRKPAPDPELASGLTMIAPEPWTNYHGHSGKTYTSTLSGRIYNVAPQDMPALLEAGCRRMLTGRWP